MASSIPKAKRYHGTEIKRPEISPTEERIVFSFSALEKTKYFNLDMTCESWSSELFDMLKSISSVSKMELFSGKLRSYRVHNHDKASPPDPLPKGVALKDCYQIRLSKSKGGIHGVFNDNIFYIIWLDPLHNMYPDNRYGGLRIARPPKTCCMERDEMLDTMQDEIDRLKEECQFWENMASDRGAE